MENKLFIATDLQYGWILETVRRGIHKLSKTKWSIVTFLQSRETIHTLYG